MTPLYPLVEASRVVLWHRLSGSEARGLGPLLKIRSSERFFEHLGVMRDKWLGHMDKQADLPRTDEPLHPQLFAKQISDRASSDAYFGVDVGECTIWVARNMRMNGDRRMVGSFNHGSVGLGFPTALGAIGLDPGRQVWAICGDGGFAMSMNDFVTAVRNKWPIKVIVFNNSSLGFVKMEKRVKRCGMCPI